jgi:hypothetical protein
MPTYIPVYQKKINSQTGEVEYGPDGLEIMELVKTIEVQDDPVFELSIPTEEDLIQLEAEILAQKQLLLELQKQLK